MASDLGFGVASEVIRMVVEPNTFMVIAGTAFGGYTQRLTVLREEDEWQLIGLDKVLVYDRTSYISFAPVNKTVVYILLFESSSQGSEFVESEYARDFKSTKHVVPNFATYYTIHTEDGDSGSRYITLSVVLIDATKDRIGRNGTEHSVRDGEVNLHPGMSPVEPEPILEPCMISTRLRPFLLKTKYETSSVGLRPSLLKSRNKTSPPGLRPLILVYKYKTWGMGTA